VRVSSPGAARERLTLRVERRIRHKAQFDAVYAEGRRFGDGFFAVTARSNALDGPRLGMAVATKTAGNSVQRNRIRRIIRESFRLRQHMLPPVDLVVSARSRVRGAVNAELRASLDALLEQVTRRCGTSPPA
jgi:ribonuclease P protein component